MLLQYSAIKYPIEDLGEYAAKHRGAGLLKSSARKNAILQYYYNAGL